ncbi:aminotransferase class IV [Kitasatospora sp. NPDC101183]|uniref:aminotransferase class IV n=1 Tax=Kitasatospora sp. NPDC101183 TaxID=3364100 RepID=UPI00382DA4D1
MSKNNELVVRPTAEPRPKPAEGEAALTDHALSMRWTKRRSWHALTVADRDDLPRVRPTAPGVRFGQTVVDEFNAHRMNDGSIAVFRPDSHVKRLNNGARRMALPLVDFDQLWAAVRQLVELDANWLPEAPGSALQLRCVLTADGDAAASRPAPAEAALLQVVASPLAVGGPAAAVRAMVSEEYARAWPGGLGDVNAAGTRGGCVVPGEIAANYGCGHVLWLDAAQHRTIEQIDGMNVFLVVDGVLTTPALDRSVLPGVLRDSVIKLARDGGATVVERAVELAEVLKGAADGQVTECFATSDETGVLPVGALLHQGVEHRLGDGPGPVTRRYAALVDGIRRGEETDRFGWMRRLTEVSAVRA